MKLLYDKFDLDIFKVDSDGRNGVHRAAANGDNDELIRIHRHYPDLYTARDKNNSTALTLASEFASCSTVKLMIEELKQNVHETGQFDRNCFLSAVAGGKNDTVVQDS